MIEYVRATVMDLEDLKQLFKMFGEKIKGFSTDYRSIDKNGNKRDYQITYYFDDSICEEFTEYDEYKSVDDIAEDAVNWGNEHRGKNDYTFFKEKFNIIVHEAFRFEYNSFYRYVTITPIWREFANDWI